MLRFRRYRVFLAFAVISVLALYHFTDVGQWEKASSISVQSLRGPAKESPKSALNPVGKAIEESATTATSDVRNPDISETSDVQPQAVSTAAVLAGGPSTSGHQQRTQSTAAAAEDDVPVRPLVAEIPTPTLNDLNPEAEIVIAQEGEGRKEVAAPTNGPVIHWTKLPEHFPVPSESVLQLPTGKPKALPKIQHPFTDENSNDKIDRERKLAAVKESFLHSWRGYKEKAWLQDELSPVSGSFRNPFCGWAATLVDALDSLWIMGLRDEFEEAAKAVDQIDFTTTFRADIPLFETTIRYLGGLLAAYDISGGKYRNLLDKAVELAEVLMGAFDTPNRMPVTYYHWKPAFASQPHRASTRVVLAEIGSLSVEFTRLSQLTKDSRYYDAIARITNEFEVWQNNTKLPGMWPVYIDASGCKKPESKTTAGIAQHSIGDVTHPNLPLLSKSAEAAGVSNTDAELLAGDVKSILSPPPAAGGARKSRIADWDVASDGANQLDSPSDGRMESHLQRRQLDSAGLEEEDAPLKQHNEHPTVAKEKLDEAQATCIPQGLASPPNSAAESFSLGGMSDSLYEYLPKEYMLLGGLNDQYKEMYEYAIEAVKRWLLFRPMTVDNRDILLSGSLKTTGHLDIEGDGILTPEGTHLTCFAGGMLAIASRLFDRQDELALGAKLTDGCVWAYESTATGIMPEGFFALPCPDASSCAWNETLYWEALDPTRVTRERQRQQRLQAPLQDSKSAVVPSKAPELDVPLEDELYASQGKPATQTEDVGYSPLDKRAENVDQDEAASLTVKGSDESGAGGNVATPLEPARPAYTPPLPQTHEEYVKTRIETEQLTPGFTSVFSSKYILRPEAIESVFIMYRVTGDEYWREKGWAMFQAVEKYTRTVYGNSAIDDVTRSSPTLKDEMESFWLAETLKYFYLLFSTPDVVSLDEYVLNTEAHPFKRPK